MLARLRQRIDARMQRWIRRRQGDDPDPVELRRGRIYILPSRTGLVYGLLVLGMLLGAMNYSNNMAFMLAFLLAALGLLAMHYAHRNLLGIVVERGRTEPVFAGQEAAFRLLLRNPSPKIRWALGAVSDHGTAYYLDLPAEGSALMPVHVQAKRRGRLRPGRIRLFTEHPLGLFHAWVVLYMPLHCIVYPAPALHAPLPPSATGDGQGKHKGRGEDDFAGLREYHGGESPRHIAWKAVARTDEMLVKHFDGAPQASTWFDFDALRASDTEERLSMLCRWILDAERDGLRYGLKLPSRRIAPGSGDAHRRACLEALALHGET